MLLLSAAQGVRDQHDVHDAHATQLLIRHEALTRLQRVYRISVRYRYVLHSRTHREPCRFVRSGIYFMAAGLLYPDFADESALLLKNVSSAELLVVFHSVV